MSPRKEYIPGGKGHREENLIVDVSHTIIVLLLLSILSVLAPLEDSKDDDDVQPSVDLSAPQLNSTAHVLNQLYALKSQYTQGPSNGEHSNANLPAPRLPTLHGGPHVGGLEDMAQRPYKVSQQVWVVTIGYT